MRPYSRFPGGKAVLFAFFALLFGFSGSALSQIRLMPLGDGVVLGRGSSADVGGFRDDLYISLNGSGIPFEFLGSLNDQTTIAPKHEGHENLPLADLNLSLNTYLTNTHPHMVVLYAGTEQLHASGANVDALILDIGNTIDIIDAYSKEVEIYLCNLIPSKDPGAEVNIVDFNTKLEGTYQIKRALGVNIYLIDLYQVFTQNPNWSVDYMNSTSDMYPNDTGYNLMASTILPVILQNSFYVNLHEFTDQFSRTALGANWNANPVFQIQNGELKNTNPTNEWSYQLAGFNVIPDPSVVQFEFGANTIPSQNQFSGVAVLFDSAAIRSSGYLIFIQSDKVNLYNLTEGIVGDNVGSAAIPSTSLQPGDRFRVEIIRNSSEFLFSVFLNGSKLAEVSQPNPIGLGRNYFGGVVIEGGHGNSVDNFYLTNVKDETPPAAISDLTVSSISPGTVQLQWTASGDDGQTGKADRYDLRYATSPITDATFPQATEIAVSLTPQSSGSTETYYVSLPYNDGETYYFAIKAIDESGNSSNISNVPEFTLAPSVVFSDDFNRNQAGPNWHSFNGVTFTDGILSAEPATDWKGFAILSGKFREYEISVRFDPSTPIGDFESVGMLVHLSDSTAQTSGYMIQWNKNSNQFNLWKLDNGSPTSIVNTAGNGNATPTTGSTIKVVSSASLLRCEFLVFVDGQFIGKLRDPAATYEANLPGYVGLLLDNRTGAQIENVTVAFPNGTAASTNYVSGNNQTGTVAQILPDPLVVNIADGDGVPIYGSTVQFELISGSASLLPPTQPDGVIDFQAEGGEGIDETDLLSDLATSNGSYFRFSSNTTKVRYDFYVLIPGYYTIWALCKSGTNNEISVALDQTNPVTWDLFQGNNFANWTWDQVSGRGNGSPGNPEIDPYRVYLSEGFHLLELSAATDGPALDRIVVTQQSASSPPQQELWNVFRTDFAGVARAFVKLGTQAGPVQFEAMAVDLPSASIPFALTANPDAAYRVAYVSGNDQVGKAGEALAEPFVVVVTDQFDNPVQGVPVDFQVTLGNGNMVENQPVLTDNNGQAQATLILGTSTFDNKVEARVDNVIGSPITFTATASSGIPTKLQYVSGDGQTGTVGNQLQEPLKVRVVDNTDSPVEGYSVTFENRSALGGTLSSTSAVTNSNGEASVLFTLGTKVGSYQVAAIGEGLQNSPVLFSLTAETGPPAVLVKVSGDSSYGVASSPLRDPFVVRLTDQFGNGVGGEMVSFRVVEGGGHFGNGSGQISVATDESGVASAVLTLGSNTGLYNNKVYAEKNGVQGSPVIFIASGLPPTASHIQLYAGNGQVGVIGKELPDPLQVKVTNALGEPAANHPVVFHVISGGGIFTESMDSVATVATNAQGIASIHFRCGPDAGPDINKIKVTSSTGSMELIGSPIWFSISARFPGVVISEVRGNNQRGIVNTQLPIPLEVKIVDDQGNPVSAQKVRFVLKTGNGKLDGQTDSVVVKTTNILGKASVVLSLGTDIGLNSYIVEASATDGFQPLQGSPITFMASAAKTNARTLVLLSEKTLTGTVGKPLSQPVRVKTVDANGDPVANQEVIFHIRSGNGTFTANKVDTLKSILTDSNGEAQINWILGTIAGSGNNRLLVTVNNGIEELENSPAELIASGLPDVTDPDRSTITATSPIPADGVTRSTITITLKDKYDNPITGATVLLTVNGEYAFLQQPANVTDSRGITVGYLASIKAGKKMVFARNTQDNVVLNQAAEIFFNAGPASQVLMTAGNDQHRNVGTVLANPLVVTVMDAYGNPVFDYPVTFKTKTGNGKILEPQPVHTDSFGVAKAQYILSDTPGDNLIEADAGDLTGSPVFFTAIGEENPPASIMSYSGDQQSGKAGHELPEPLVVQVKDRAGNPVKNAEVYFHFVFGEGRILDDQPARSDAYGYAKTRVAVGYNAGSNVISATLDSTSVAQVDFVASVLPDDPYQLEIVSGNKQSIQLNSESQPLLVRVLDRYRNPVPGATVRFDVLDGPISLTQNQATSNTLGVAATSILTSSQAGTAHVKAVLPEIQDHAVVFEATIQSATPSKLMLVGADNLVVTLGQQIARPLQAKVIDSFGNPVPGIAVSFVISSGDAELVGGQTKTTNENGVAGCYVNVGPNAATIEVLATSTADPGTILTYHLNAVANNVPVMDPISDGLIREHETLDFSIHATDPDGDNLEIAIDGLPQNATVQQKSNNTWQFNWTPSYDQAGDYEMVVTVYDNKNGGARDTVRIHVEDVNRLPVVSYVFPQGDTSLVPGAELHFQLLASDPDGSPVQILWYQNGEFQREAPVFVYRSSPTFTGSEIVDAYVTDGIDTISYHWTLSIKTAVTLAMLDAFVNEDNSGIVLEWKTSYEQNNLGFDVFRASSANGNYKKITEKLIPSTENGTYSFHDTKVAAGVRYFYKIVDRNIRGAATEHGPVSAEIPLPESFVLSQNYPNPFSPEHNHSFTRFRVEVPRKELVEIQIFNVLGQMVRTIVTRELVPGYYTFSWDGRDLQGNPVSSGIYFYRLKAGKFTQLKRLVIMR